MQLTKVTDGPEVRALRPHNSDKGQVALAGLCNLAARKYSHAIGVQQQATIIAGSNGGASSFILIRCIETAQIQLGHHIEQVEDHIALWQLGVRA